MKYNFGYALVSTVGQCLTTQLDILKNAGCDRIFHDKTASECPHRPALHELLKRLRVGDTVMVTRLMHLGSNCEHVIHLVNFFHQRGIHFKALDPKSIGIDTTAPTGTFMLSLFALLAESDREFIPKKTQADQQPTTTQNEHIGRPRGFDTIKYAIVLKALKRDLSVTEVEKLTGISAKTIRRYRNHLQAGLA